uniref:Deacetylvindoline O-acetyltransferase-like n=2 Tax=Nicotiana TaxID=4085 RepID=A0A1S4BHJ1_TOBAC|nr:PREDICTED: deacetylvindoline O-acetyltransferase-like [Nicotiana sylvestris]XP_016488321.1 PREDICTED: deacetylvindoline O-acetyltransferase-like [Nicotiana tabacum]
MSNFVTEAKYGGESFSSDEQTRLFLLKKSLSVTLARFYTFAGRIKDHSIECNDNGVPFYEAFAHYNYQFEDVFRKPDIDKLTARDSTDDYVIPDFVAAAESLPPPIPHVSPKSMRSEMIKILFDEQRVAKLFAFDASTIASLKAKAVSDSVQVPTRVEVVSAAIWKCAMVASGNERRSSRLAHNVNIRKRLVPPLPNHCVGNVVTPATACKGENDGSDLPTLVTCIRKTLSELSSKYMDYKKNRDEAILAIPYDTAELFAAIFRGEIDLHISSLCGYQFYVDFGWGKPSWVSRIQDFGTNA